MTRSSALLMLGLLGWCSEGLAETVVFKHDEFSSDLFAAVAQVQGKSLPTYPGFAKDEAYGQVFSVPAGSYPLKVLGLQMLFAAPPNAPDLKTHVQIEFYYDASSGPAPSKAEPDWSVSTEDLFDPNTGATGLPIQGGVGVQIEFDWSDPANHPPLMTSGNLWVVLRFYQAPLDLSGEWGTMQCIALPDQGFCGCQKVGVLGDTSITPHVGVVHHLAAGQCSGAMTWSWAEDLGLKGDAILRVKVEKAGGCVPDCSGKECGDDGCGGICGTCPAGKTCAVAGPDAGHCVPTCTPICDGLECGDGGCTDRPDACGVCGAAQACVEGRCVAIRSCGNGACEPTAQETCESCPADCACDCGEECRSGTCVFTACEGLDCGDDGCGGSCGNCAPGQVCQGGHCAAAVSLEIFEVSPSFGFSDEETAISVAGVGFKPGLAARLGGTLLSAIQVVGEGLFTAVVPAGMEPGMYTLFVSNPDGQSAYRKDAFEVRTRVSRPDEAGTAPDTGGVEDAGPKDIAPEDLGPGDTGAASTSGGGGCRSGAGAEGPAWMLVAVVFLALRRPARRDGRETD